MLMLRRFLKSDRAVAAIEFVMISPVLIVLIAAVVEFGLIYRVYEATNRLAAQYAISWADCSDVPSGTCLSEAANYTSTSTIGNLAPTLVTANVGVRMFQVKMSGSTLSVTYASPSTATMTTTEKTTATDKLTNGDVGVVVTVNYAHTLQFFSGTMSPFLGNHLNISYSVAQLK